MSGYAGVDGVARKLTRFYYGDENGVAQELTGLYVGVGDAAREVPLIRYGIQETTGYVSDSVSRKIADADDFGDDLDSYAYLRSASSYEFDEKTGLFTLVDSETERLSGRSGVTNYTPWRTKCYVVAGFGGYPAASGHKTIYLFPTSNSSDARIEHSWTSAGYRGVYLASSDASVGYTKLTGTRI